MNGYDIKFSINNPNSLEFRKDGRLCHLIAIPPIDKGCDILTFNETIRGNYTYDFQGFIIITTEEERTLYCKGEIICKTKR
jgi:hypothetical protein